MSLIDEISRFAHEMRRAGVRDSMTVVLSDDSWRLLSGALLNEVGHVYHDPALRYREDMMVSGVRFVRQEEER